MDSPFRRSRGYGQHAEKPGTPTDALPINPDRLQPEPTGAGALQELIAESPPELQRIIFDALRYGELQFSALNIGAASQLILQRPRVRRTYLLLVNTHPAQRLFIGFGTDATLLSLPLEVNLGRLLMDSYVSQNPLYAIGAGAGTTGVLIWAEV